jgi:CRP-like cAMP-binding protein
MEPENTRPRQSTTDRAPCKATLRAVGSATVYTLEPDAFNSLLQAHPGIVYKVMQALFRITHTNLVRMNQESRELTNYITKIRGRY